MKTLAVGSLIEPVSIDTLFVQLHVPLQDCFHSDVAYAAAIRNPVPKIATSLLSICCTPVARLAKGRCLAISCRTPHDLDFLLHFFQIV